jgi:TIR domain/Restriction endonuclease
MATVESRQNESRQVFLSYAHADSAVARRIAAKLRGAGLRVQISEWELQPGDSIASRIIEAVSSSDLILVLLSPNSINSRWVQTELNETLSRELQTRAITVIPALVEDCTMPPPLANLVYLDLRSDLEGGIDRLIQQLGIAPDIDFSRLDPQSFESLVADLLRSLGFSIEHQALSSDSGFDFKASFPTRDPFGARHEDVWLVEVKHYKNQRVSVDAVRQMVSYMTMLPGAKKGLVVTSAQLTSVAQEVLAELTTNLRTELRVIEGTELKRLLLEHPQLVKRYFGQEAQP